MLRDHNVQSLEQSLKDRFDCTQKKSEVGALCYMCMCVKHYSDVQYNIIQIVKIAKVSLPVFYVQKCL